MHDSTFPLYIFNITASSPPACLCSEAIFWLFLLINPPQTESAREARKSFYCELCQKGYSRINEFEAHEGSYDHQHKKVR